MLTNGEVDVECIQETGCRGSACRFFGAKGKRYRLFWIGGKENDGVGIFVAEKWVDGIVSTESHIERALILRMVLDNVFMIYASHSGNQSRKFLEQIVAFGELCTSE